APPAPPEPPAPPSPPEPPAPPVSDACGAQILKADGTPWQCTFHDDFDGAELDRSQWAPQTLAYTTGDATAGYACYVDDPKNISVGGGMLSLTVRREDSPQPCLSATSLDAVSSPYTAGMVSTYHLFSQQYGRFEARIRNTASSAPGLQETFWLWPDDRYVTLDWPTTGEIDVSETYSVFADLSIPFLHYGTTRPEPSVPGVNTAYDCIAHRGVWNIYTLEWTPTTLTILVNGQHCLTNESGDSAFQRPYLLALTQALGQRGQTDNSLTDATPLPATMDVDYVRVWK
ncbi:MAG TPA: glycoside hydrolase family 16 protein, partial [Marmoricola sp.]|nr:glycoside hydrolase family 16 protein [Marmoricola sp.]